MTKPVEIKDAMDSTLKKVLPVCKTALLHDGQEINLRRFRTRQYADILQSLMTIMGYVDIKNFTYDQLPLVFSLCYSDVAALIATSSGLTVDEIDNLDLDDSITLAWEVYQLNINFFNERVSPVLRKLLGESYDQLTLKLQAQTNQVKDQILTGQEFSISSSTEATDTSQS